MQTLLAIAERHKNNLGKRKLIEKRNNKKIAFNRWINTGITIPGIFLCMFMAKTASSAEIKIRFYQNISEPLKNAVVALEPLTNPVFSDQPQAQLDQRNYQFVPDVMVIRTNTLVYFPNSDDVRHHVYSFSPAKKFELRLYHGKTAEPVLFDKPGKVALGCNIHDSMVATLYVVDTPYFAQSDQDGLAVIQDLPPGSYRLAIYHPYRQEDLPAQLLEIGSNDKLQKVIQLDGLVKPVSGNGDDEYANLFE